MQTAIHTHIQINASPPPAPTLNYLPSPLLLYPSSSTSSQYHCQFNHQTVPPASWTATALAVLVIWPHKPDQLTMSNAAIFALPLGSLKLLQGGHGYGCPPLPLPGDSRPQTNKLGSTLDHNPPPVLAVASLPGPPPHPNQLTRSKPAIFLLLLGSPKLLQGSHDIKTSIPYFESTQSRRNDMSGMMQWPIHVLCVSVSQARVVGLPRPHASARK